jgi:hypothetical protein
MKILIIYSIFFFGDTLNIFIFIFIFFVSLFVVDARDIDLAVEARLAHEFSQPPPNEVKQKK